MSTAAAVFAWIGLALGLGVALLVVALFQRVLTPLREIKRLAGDTLDAGLGITRHLDGADELLRTHELATAVPGLATAYLGKLGEAP